MAPSRPRRLAFLLLVVLALVNAPVLMSLATQASVAARGTEVTAEVVGGRLLGGGADPEYWLYYRFDEEVDEEREAFGTEVDRATYARARETREVAARVVPGDAVAHEVEGAQPQRLGLWTTLGIDAAVLLAVALWWLRRRAAAGGAADPLPHSGP